MVGHVGAAGGQGDEARACGGAGYAGRLDAAAGVARVGGGCCAEVVVDPAGGGFCLLGEEVEGAGEVEGFLAVEEWGADVAEGDGWGRGAGGVA